MSIRVVADCTSNREHATFDLLEWIFYGRFSNRSYDGVASIYNWFKDGAHVPFYIDSIIHRKVHYVITIGFEIYPTQSSTIRKWWWRREKASTYFRFQCVSIWCSTPTLYPPQYIFQSILLFSFRTSIAIVAPCVCVLCCGFQLKWPSHDDGMGVIKNAWRFLSINSDILFNWTHTKRSMLHAKQHTNGNKRKITLSRQEDSLLANWPNS